MPEHGVTSTMPGPTPLRLSGMVEESIVDGPGLRLVLFTQAKAAIIRKRTTARAVFFVM